MLTHAIQDVHKWLKAEGLREISGYIEGYAYEGEFDCKGVIVPIRLSFPDLNFVELPKIHLVEPRPEALRKPLPHIDHRGQVCYLEQESYRADRYRPLQVMATLLAKAKEVLKGSITGENSREVGYEFQSYWEAHSRGITLSDDKTLKTARYNVVEYKTPTGKKQELTVIGSEEEIDKFAVLHQGKKKYGAHGHAIWIRLSANALLPLNIEWPPVHPKGLFLWLKEVDPGAANRLQWVLGTKDGAHNPLLIAMRTQQGSMVGFEITLLAALASSAKQPGQFKKLVLSDTGRFGTKVKRIIVDDLSARYQVTRNLAGANLVNKNIVLIGCGTIGGYLARLMIQAGAGQGTGKLTLYDEDEFRPGNIGRHYLDSAYLYENKAVACCHKLLFEYPSANIVAKGQKYRSLKQAARIDIIVEATGLEASSALLNAEAINCHRTNRTCPPILYSWIDGGGNCVRSLYYDGTAGCYRCLLNTQGKERYEPLLAPSSTPPVVYQCGESYTPYPASVSVHAAGLALDALLDWAQGKASPHFRSMVLSQKARQHKSQNLTMQEQCPACQT